MSSTRMTGLRCDITDDKGACGRELVDYGNVERVREIAAEQGWTRQGSADVCDDHSEGGQTA